MSAAHNVVEGKLSLQTGQKVNTFKQNSMKHEQHRDKYTDDFAAPNTLCLHLVNVVLGTVCSLLIKANIHYKKIILIKNKTCN